MLQHPKFIIQDQIDLLNLILTIFNNMQTFFVDKEEKRLAYAFFKGLKVRNFLLPLLLNSLMSATQN
ncbi:hypothetical protein F5ESL0228_06730 [Lactobacillus sp. ESL0228]|nr:hypothetical protein F5ESL0228_06730 [Lactobacillus sp. ESL0228]